MKPSRRLATVWRLRLMMIACLLLFLFWALYRFFPVAGILGGTVLAGCFWMLWAWIPRYCSRFRYRLDGAGLEVTGGLFFPRLVWLPAPQTLYSCVYRTPLYFLTGLYGVAVWGAGAHALLPGLTQEQARAVLCGLTHMQREEAEQ